MSKPSDNPRLEEIATSCAAMRSRMLQRTIARRFDAALRKHGVNSGQFSLLVAIGLAGQARSKDLGDGLSLSPAATTRALDVLERNGWIATPIKTGRMRVVELTGAGTRLIETAHADWRAANQDVTSRIGAIPRFDTSGEA
ncbi:MAG: MarR family transcriptional regulator [Pseudomonadota bacterium]